MSHSIQAPGTRLYQAADQPPALMLRRATLKVEVGADAGRELNLEGTLVRVGSGPQNELVLSDETVSVRHFELRVTDSGVLVRDCGSTNGTYVDGQRVEGVYLNHAAEIRAGATVLQFCVADDEIAIPVSRSTNFGDLLGHSPLMRAAFAVLEPAARTEATVLVLGESGTGKELAARAIHARSARSDGPFVVFDCGAASRSLIESQLFGHARGAFTGATDARAGVFEEAHGGTLVLDEIGELPMDLQPKLLRALETRSIQRIGETKPRSVDVRFVACTNRNLDDEVRKGAFRSDLFFRLSVIRVQLPPLRERKEEIPRLFRHFLGKLGADSSQDFPPTIEALLHSYDWPGNVRELRNFVERYVALPGIPATELLPQSAPQARTPDPLRDPIAHAFHEAKSRWIDHFERDYLERLLQAHGGNMSEAARVAGLSRQTCYRLMHKHGFRVD